MPLSTPSALPHGAERAALVAPHSETTRVPAAAAMCIGPESGPNAARARAKMPMRSRNDRPARQVGHRHARGRGHCVGELHVTRAADQHRRQAARRQRVGHRRGALGKPQPALAARTDERRDERRAHIGQQRRRRARASSSVSCKPKLTGIGGSSSQSAKRRNCSSFELKCGMAGTWWELNSQLPSRELCR